MIGSIYAVQSIGLKSSEWELSLFSECNYTLSSLFTFRDLSTSFHIHGHWWSLFPWRRGAEKGRRRQVLRQSRLRSDSRKLSKHRVLPWEHTRFVFTVSIFNHLYRYLDIMYIEYKQYCKLNFYLLNCKSKIFFMIIN